MNSSAEHTKGQELALKTDLFPHGPQIVVHYTLTTEGVRLISALEDGRSDRDLMESLRPEELRQLQYRCIVN